MEKSWEHCRAQAARELSSRESSHWKRQGEP